MLTNEAPTKIGAGSSGEGDVQILGLQVVRQPLPPKPPPAKEDRQPRPHQKRRTNPLSHIPPKRDRQTFHMKEDRQSPSLL